MPRLRRWILPALIGAALVAGGQPATAKVPAGFPGLNLQNVRHDLRTGDPLTLSDYTRLRKGGSRTMRLLLLWPVLQPTEGSCYAATSAGDTCDFADVDHVVRLASKAGIKVKFFIYGTPSWVANDQRRLPVDNAHAKRAWKRFVKAAVGRYGSGGKFWRENPQLKRRPARWWQVSNEVNGEAFVVRPSPSRYATLVKLTSRVISKADRKAKLVLAGIFATPVGNRAIDSPKFMRRLLRQRGIKRSFDVAAVHPYAGNVRDVKRQVKIVRKALNRAGLKRRKIALSEFGWGSEPGPYAVQKSRRGQKTMVKKVLRLLKRNRRKWRIDSFNYFSAFDSEPGPKICKFCESSGLFDLDRQPKPAWRAFRNNAG